MSVRYQHHLVPQAPNGSTHLDPADAVAFAASGELVDGHCEWQVQCGWLGDGDAAVRVGIG